MCQRAELMNAIIIPWVHLDAVILYNVGRTVAPLETQTFVYKRTTRE